MATKSYYQSFLSCIEMVLREHLIEPKLKHQLLSSEMNLLTKEIMAKIDQTCKDHGVDWKLDGDEKNEEQESPPFGTIVEMPKKLAKSEVVVISVLDKFAHQAEPRSVCLPHQLYKEKLQKILDDPDTKAIFVYPASRSFEVHREEKRIWIE